MEYSKVFVNVGNYNSHNGWFLKHTAFKRSPFVIYSLNNNKGNRQQSLSINSLIRRVISFQPDVHRWTMRELQ